MTDQQLLDISNSSDKAEIRQALLNKISDLDFEIDIELVFNYIRCAQRLFHNADTAAAQTQMILSDADKILAQNTGETCTSPEKLIEHFTNLYNNSSTRFNKFLWKASIDFVKANDAENLNSYCKPIADFLVEKPFLKSEILRLLANAFPFAEFFPNPELEENKEFWKQYAYIYNLLRKGNVELDLLAHTVEAERFTPGQLDDIYNRVLYSSRYYREGNFAQAFSVLSEGIPANVKPLVVWQRELNILYKAAFIDKESNAADIFVNTLNTALSYYPFDGQLLYERAKFILLTYEPVQAKDAIVEIVKLVPDHEKCMFLLGKSYKALGISRAASIIFENLAKLNPLNLEYVTAAATASRAYIDFCIEKHDPKDNSKQYYINIISELVERNMFEEAGVFARQAPENDADISALIIYALEIQTYVYEGTKDKEALFDALLVANDKEIRRKIKEHYLKDIPNWTEIAEEKKFIQNFYQEYPDDSMANYHMAMYYHATSDFKQAYDYFLKAKEIDPSNTTVYYNLARSAAKIEKYEEAVQYIRVYLMYNKYQLQANEYYCEWVYELKQYDNSHESAKWILSICRTDEFATSHFFYFTAGLSLCLNSIPKEYHNLAYIYDTLALYDQYPKPADFWSDEDGLKSICWAAKLCYDLDEHEKCIDYIMQTLPHITDDNSPAAKMGLFELLPKSLYKLERYEEIIELISERAQDMLINNGYEHDMAPAAFYLTLAYGALKQYELQMEWSVVCVNSYMLTETPPIEWIENFLTDKFSVCVEHNVDSYIIPIGTAYLEIIKTTNLNHIWMAHNMANVYAAFEQDEEALEYHKKCLAFCLEFPGECEEERIGSQAFINAYTTSIK